MMNNKVEIVGEMMNSLSDIKSYNGEEYSFINLKVMNGLKNYIYIPVKINKFYIDMIKSNIDCGSVVGVVGKLITYKNKKGLVSFYVDSKKINFLSIKKYEPVDFLNEVCV